MMHGQVQFSALHESLLSQRGAKKGLESREEAGAEAVTKELCHIHNKGAVIPLKPTAAINQQKKDALQHSTFLKKKGCGRIKGHGCADGHKQRNHLSKENTSSPTVSTKAFMMLHMMDAMEGRDAATVDAPGVFLLADMKNIADARIDGAMANLLRKVDQEERAKHVVQESGKSTLCA